MKQQWDIEGHKEKHNFIVLNVVLETSSVDVHMGILSIFVYFEKLAHKKL